MKHLIIFHYHFLPGGVTDVVSSSVTAYLTHSRLISRITIVSGRTSNLDIMEQKIRKSLPETKQKSLSFEHLPSIDYQENLPSGTSSVTIKKELLEKFGSEKNIWWIHNYHLGKNPFFTKALIDISQLNKQKMVFHIHDFPECSRHRLLKRLTEEIQGDFYPRNNNSHYAVINNRDYKFLTDAGLNREKITLLENPVKTVNLETDGKKEIITRLSDKLSGRFPGWKNNQPYMLYPVRAIRRKNIAEAALIAALSEKNLIVTLPGISETEKEYSRKCETIFTEGLSPGMFGIGYAIGEFGISFEELISSSSMIISSSVQEGFGYLFLNSMNWGKPLFAKNLDILDSFKKSFEGYPSLFYNRFSVPLETEEKETLEMLYRKKSDRLSECFSPSVLTDLNAQFHQIINCDYTDFSYLSLDMQINILKKIKEDYDFLKKCRKINQSHIKIINNFFEMEINPNHEIIEENWSYPAYNKKTEEILNFFGRKAPKTDQIHQNPPIYETMQSRFQTVEYLRVLYDE